MNGISDARHAGPAGADPSLPLEHVRLQGPLLRYLTSLIRRHRALDEEIRDETRASRGNSQRLGALKRMRLALKDRIALLDRGTLRQPG